MDSEDPPTAPWLPMLLIHIGSQVKTRWSQSYKFKEFAKSSNFLILMTTLQATQLLKLFDKMCKYEMDLAGIVEDTERTRFCPQTDGRTDGQGETSIPPSTSLNGWYNKSCQRTAECTQRPQTRNPSLITHQCHSNTDDFNSDSF